MLWILCENIVSWHGRRKTYGFVLPTTNRLKQISFNQKYLILQNHFQLNNSYAFPKVILHECQRSGKYVYLYSSFVYSMSDDVVHCIDCAIFLSMKK